MKTPVLNNESMLQRKRNVLIPCVHHFYENPPVIDHGQGMWLVDTEGRRYLDLLSGVSVNALGHCHPEVVAAIQDQAGRLANMTTIYLTEPMIRLAERLVELGDGRLSRAFFCTSGSEANEMALFLARVKSGRPGVFALKNGLHGNTRATLSVTGVDFWKQYVDPLPEVRHAEAPYCRRCPLGLQPENCGSACLDAMEKFLIRRPEACGAVILEVIQGNGGILCPPAAYFHRLQDLVERYRMTLIVDEVQTGLGRTGRFFAYMHHGLKPDIVTLAKSLGGGLPIGAVLTTEAAGGSFGFPRASTFGGNPIVCRAALAVLEVIEREGLVERAAVLGAFFLKRLRALQARHSIIGDVRGLGLMLGIELVRPDQNPAPRETDWVLNRLKDRGILLGKGGPHRNVLILQPPLIINRMEIQSTLHTLDSILGELPDAEEWN